MVPLTVRSHYSLMWGVPSIRRLCRAARQMGYDRLALTDTDNLYGLWPFLKACRQEGLRPMIGAEVTDPGSGQRAVCLVENDTGYRNLCRLLTRRHCDAAFDLGGTLPTLARGLVVLTRDADLLQQWHTAGVYVAAALPRRPLPSGHRLCRTAKTLKVPLVATPGSFFLTPADARIHRLLRAIDGNTSLTRLAPQEVAPPDAWLAAPGEYRSRFASCPAALRATHALAERLAFRGPQFGLVMPSRCEPSGRSAAEALHAAAYAGAIRRYGNELPETVVNRLEHELQTIATMGFSDYFLIVRDIVARSPRTCGRGSGAASLVAYCLAITNVCPLKHNLYFERFLNPGRTDPPDIDVDFAWDERDDVLQAVLDRHRGHAALVANHVSFRPRMALREIARVFGLTDGEIGRVAKRLPRFWRATETDSELLEHLRQHPAARTLTFPPPWPEIMQAAQQIVGLPRHLSVHPGGVVITPAPIDTYVPVEQAPKGVPIIQWEKDATEEAGLVKIDLLGNRSLGVIRDTVQNLRANNMPFDELRWEPEDDFATQEAVAQGHTMGCFYIESPAMRLLQQKAGVGDFEHLVIHSSIIRPAANEFIREYLRRLHGGAWDPIHPLLAEVLDETFGIMVYQEDVSRAAVALAGFSHAEADGLRKILSKKDRRHHLRDWRARFFAGARNRGVAMDRIEAVWDMIMSFSGYSFCKPHSASYARVSFQAAYLKVHFPAEFMAAVISNRGGFYSTFAYVSEARRMGLTILPPAVGASDIHWLGNGNTLRVGLLAIKNLATATQKRIVAQRRQGAYTGLDDFLDRTRPDEAEARALIQCGALDAFAPEGRRAALLWHLARWQRTAAHPVERRLPFTGEMAAAPCPPLPPDDERRRLRHEFAVLGFLCDRHPIELYAETLGPLGRVKIEQLGRFVSRRVRVIGWLITGKVVRTQKGDAMQFLTFEDESGRVETTFFPRAYRRFCHLLDYNRPYVLHGEVDQDWGAITLTVDRVDPA